MRRTAIALLAVAVTMAAGCSGSDPNLTPAPAAADTGDDLGKVYEFKDPTGQPVATIRFVDVMEVPAECVDDPTAQPIGLRIEMANLTGAKLDHASSEVVQVNDSRGYSSKTTAVELNARCKDKIPALALPPAPGKSTGWEFVRSPIAHPSALVFTPVIWSEKASLSNWELIQSNPTHVVVRLPRELQRPGPPAEESATPTVTPTTSAPAAAPSTTPTAAVSPKAGQGCDVSGARWAKDAAGSQLVCAYAGGATPKWVGSLPYIGVRDVGGACELGVAVAESRSGQTMVCIGEEGAGTWAPGP